MNTCCICYNNLLVYTSSNSCPSNENGTRAEEQEPVLQQGYGLDDMGFDYQKVKISILDQPASYSIRTVGCFPRDKADKA